MHPFMLPVPFFPWKVRALWPSVIAYRLGAAITTQQMAREMVRITQMQSLGWPPYLIFHLLFPRVCRARRHNWETVHYVEARNILERLARRGITL